MFRRRLACLPVAIAAAVALAGCGPTGSTSSTGSAGTAASSTSAPRTQAPPTDAAGLGRFLKDGAQKIHSAHLSMNVAAGEQTITATGDETLAHGKLTGLDLAEQVPGAGEIRILITGGKTYAKLPESLDHSPEPWVLVTTQSTDPIVARLASSLEQVQQSASLDQFRMFTGAASGLVVKGQEDVGGHPATHYALTVDVTKLPDGVAGKQELASAGVSTLPIDLWVDGQGRPVQLREQLTVQGQQVSTEVTIGDFDAPVTITAPPADQVSTQ